MHNYGFGQTHSKDLVKCILKKFSLQFSEFYIIYYQFLSL
jgi:hypothetical protein